MPPPNAPGGARRFKIARGAVANLRPVITVFLGIVVVVLAVGIGLIPLLHIKGPAAVLVTPGALFALVAALIVYMNLPGHLDLGEDGVLIDWRGTSRYVRFADVDDAGPYSESVVGKTIIGVSFLLRSGELVKAAIGEDQFGADKKVAELSESVRAALAAYRRREIGEDAPALARGDRSIHAWRDRLRGLGEGANAGPRDAPLPADRLWRIVEDPTAEVEARAGAAVALGPALDDAGKQRLRVAAEATAAPKLRIALEAAASNDEEAVTAALTQIGEERA